MLTKKKLKPIFKGCVHCGEPLFLCPHEYYLNEPHCSEESLCTGYVHECCKHKCNITENVLFATPKDVYVGKSAQKDSRFMRKHSASLNKHIPNKNEGSMLRKIMSQTGLTEKQVRSKYIYRVMLADASKKGAMSKKVDEQNRHNAAV